MWKTAVAGVFGLVLAAGPMGTSVAQFGDSNEIRMGVVTPRGIMASHKKWRHLGRYLSEILGQRVNMVYMPPNLLRESAKMGNLDLVFANPTLVIDLEEQIGYKPISTLKRKKTGSQFGGVIVARADSGIKVSADLKGKSVRYFRKASAAAYLFQVHHLMNNGIIPERDFSVFEQQPNARKQDEIVLSVVNGEIDAGFVKTGLIEAMVREGKIKLEQIVIVDQQSSEFPQAHSTHLYPEWTVAASKDFDNLAVVKIAAALAKLSKNDLAAKQAGIEGFEAPHDLGALKRAMATVKATAGKS